jgi:4-diphosphocytidyl-2C-methyl-D-erythritol kinase
MPTADAFQRVAELRGGAYRPEAFRMGLGRVTTWDGVESMAANSFETVADERLPDLARARETMLSGGARIAMLAGSGSALFGVFSSSAERDAAEPLVRELGFATWRAETLHAGPAPQIA